MWRASRRNSFHQQVNINYINYIIISQTLDTHTPAKKGIQSKYWTRVKECLDTETETPMNNRQHERVLLHFIDIATYNNLLSKPTIF